jgi:hypothetical protein
VIAAYLAGLFVLLGCLAALLAPVVLAVLVAVRLLRRLLRGRRIALLQITM